MKPRPRLIIALLTLAVFITDAIAPAGLIVWLGYILPLYLAAKYFTKKQFYLFTAALSALVILGGLFPSSEFSSMVVIFNRTAGIITGWVIAILLMRQRTGQESLRDMDEKLRALVEESPVGNFLVQDGRFVYVNNRLAGLFGYTKEELFALNTVSSLPIPRITKKRKKFYETSVPATKTVPILISGGCTRTARPCMSSCIYSIPRMGASRRRWGA